MHISIIIYINSNNDVMIYLLVRMNSMAISIGLFIFTIVVYVPLASLLLYVWHKYGREEKAVRIARAIFLIGSLSILGYMLAL